MLKKILGGMAVVILGIVAYAALQSADYQVSREIVVKASPEAVFPYINSSKKSNEWMPWAASDPEMKMTHSGPEEGVGSKSNWESKGKMGTGEAEIVESQPNQSVKTKLTYLKPMEMSQIAEVSLTPSAEGTLVRWSVAGRNDLIGRVVCLFMNMDKMVGGEFEKGLANLKRMVEGSET